MAFGRSGGLGQYDSGLSLAGGSSSTDKKKDDSNEDDPQDTRGAGNGGSSSSDSGSSSFSSGGLSGGYGSGRYDADLSSTDTAGANLDLSASPGNENEYTAKASAGLDDAPGSSGPSAPTFNGRDMERRPDSEPDNSGPEGGDARLRTLSDQMDPSGAGNNVDTSDTTGSEPDDRDSKATTSGGYSRDYSTPTSSSTTETAGRGATPDQTLAYEGALTSIGLDADTSDPDALQEKFRDVRALSQGQTGGISGSLQDELGIDLSAGTNDAGAEDIPGPGPNPDPNPQNTRVGPPPEDTDADGPGNSGGQGNGRGRGGGGGPPPGVTGPPPWAMGGDKSGGDSSGSDGGIAAALGDLSTGQQVAVAGAGTAAVGGIAWYLGLL